MKREKLSKELLSKFSRISAHGIILVVVTFLGLSLGLYLDKVTHMAPNFTLVFLVIGVVLGFKGFIDEVVRERRVKS